VQEAADLGLGVHLTRALLEAADEHHRPEPLLRGIGLREIALIPLLLPLSGLDRHRRWKLLHRLA
jgi:hypothetical protein